MSRQLLQPGYQIRRTGFPTESLIRESGCLSHCRQRFFLYGRNVIIGVVCVGSKLTASTFQLTDDLNIFPNGVTTVDCWMVMLELPSPPFQSEYGEYERIQYLAGKRQNTHLFPRHRFLFIFVARYATLDTIHLGQARHS